MPISFSDHAKKQTKRRKISEELVIKAVKSPQEMLSSFRGRKLRRVPVGDKILEVVTRTEGSKITIVTAYYLEENI